MKRRIIVAMVLVMILVLAACGGGSGNPDLSGSDKGAANNAPVGETKVVKIAHGASESYHMHRAMVKFKDELEKGGNFKVEIYPSSQFGNDTEMIESVKTGDLNIAVSPSSFMTDEVPSMALIELPYVFPSREVAVKTLEGEWAQEQLALFENVGLHGLGFLENGMRHITNSKHEIRKPEDLKGLKIRTMQVPAHVEYWNSVGCSAEGSPFPELYTNLSTKVFDGQENPIAHIYSQKFYEVQNYLTLSGHVYTAYIPLMTMDYWDSLSAKEQELFNKAFKTCYDYQMQLIQEEEKVQLDEIANNTTYSTQVTELTVEEKQAFIDSAQPTLQKYREQLGADIYDKFIEAIQKAS